MNGNPAGERLEKKDGLCGLACRIYGRIAMEKKMDAGDIVSQKEYSIKKAIIS